MCGRYALFMNDGDTAMQRMIELCNRSASASEQIETNGEICPGESAPALIEMEGKTIGVSMRWGFQTNGGTLVINARSEDARSRRMFAKLVDAQRCALPARGYYEWRKRDHLKYSIALEDGGALYLAGLYNSDVRGGYRFVVLTRAATGAHSDIHERMPVVLTSREAARRWISGEMALESAAEGAFSVLQIVPMGVEQLRMDWID